MPFIIYGLVLVVFWILALRIKPEHYPLAKPEDVLQWQGGKLYDYRRYSGYLLIWILLAFINGALGSYAYKHTPPSKLLHYTFYGLLGLTIVVVIFSLVDILLHAIRRHRWAKSVGIKK